MQYMLPTMRAVIAADIQGGIWVPYIVFFVCNFYELHLDSKVLIQ